MLKQPQYQPLAVERQVLVIFAGTNGFLDEVAESDVAAYERELYEFMEVRHRDVLERLIAQKKLDDELRSDVSAAIKAFTEQFTAARKGVAA